MLDIFYKSSLSLNIPPEMTSRCTHTENHTRCKKDSLPYTKYCCDRKSSLLSVECFFFKDQYFTDILEDPHQQLYAKCHSSNCSAPVRLLSAGGWNDANDSNEQVYCILHLPLPSLNFKMPKEITEFKENESSDLEVNLTNYLWQSFMQLRHSQG